MYKTSEHIITVVYGLLSSINKPKYKGSKPSLKDDAEYIVINTLGVNAMTMQNVRVNVNYHVKDISGAMGYAPDFVKLAAGSLAVLTILEKVTGSDYMIDFEGQEIIPEYGKEEHYSNLKFSFKQIN
jgi:hypothetical protein